MDGLGSGLEMVFKALIISFICAVVFGIYSIFTFFAPKTIESKAKISPTYILTTDGKKVDTLYIYKEK